MKNLIIPKIYDILRRLRQRRRNNHNSYLPKPISSHSSNWKIQTMGIAWKIIEKVEINLDLGEYWK